MVQTFIHLTIYDALFFGININEQKDMFPPIWHDVCNVMNQQGGYIQGN
jgi:hypothetical protein